MKKTLFIKNAAVLTVSSLILRFLGVIFKVWLSNTVGSEGIGLYQVIFSLYMLASTFASSGISTAVTRIVAECSARNDTAGIKKAVKRAAELSLAVALISAGLLIMLCPTVSKYILHDSRAAYSVRVFAISLPFMGVSSCLRGYFIGMRRATPTAFAQIAEQLLRIGTVVLLLKRFAKYGLSVSCAVVFAGDTAAEILCCCILYLVYRQSIKKQKSSPNVKIRGTGLKILRIATPITAGRYLNSLLRTGENVLVPESLAKYGGGSSALSLFGMIKGMALPILFFPSGILHALSTMLIPEMSEAMALGHKNGVKHSAERIITVTIAVSVLFAAVFFCAGERIGILIYKNKDVGFLLKCLAPIVPLMYLDSVCDGFLKGLDQQRFTFRISVADSAIRLFLVALIVPRWGLYGFLMIMYFSNIFTCVPNCLRLIKITGAEMPAFKTVILPVIAAFFLASVTSKLLTYFGVFNNLVYIILFCLINTALYGAFVLMLLGDRLGITLQSAKKVMLNRAKA